MKLTLIDNSRFVTNALQVAFAAWKDVYVKTGDAIAVIEHYDCVVSPANSFGLMDGGFDQALTDYFGAGLQAVVQREIKLHYRGEQPVGTCLLVPILAPKHDKPNPRFLAHAPTMRTPKVIAGTDNVYLAMRAVLLAVLAFNEHDHPEGKIESILCPGLGTLTGRMPCAVAAQQMAAAYQATMVETVPNHITWEYARGREKLVNEV